MHVKFSWKIDDYGPYLGFYYDPCDYDEKSCVYLGFLFGRVWLSWGAPRFTIFGRYGLNVGRNVFQLWLGVFEADCNYRGGTYVCVFWWDALKSFLFGNRFVGTRNNANN